MRYVIIPLSIIIYIIWSINAIKYIRKEKIKTIKDIAIMDSVSSYLWVCVTFAALATVLVALSVLYW